MLVSITTFTCRLYDMFQLSYHFSVHRLALKWVQNPMQVLESIVFLVKNEKDSLQLMVGGVSTDIYEAQRIFAMVEDPLHASKVEKVRSKLCILQCE